MISTKAMIPGIRQAKTAELTALGTSSREEGARPLSAKHGVDRCYSSYQQLLEDPGIDGVYIGLPNHLHKEWTLKALAHGKHVLCDKPLGMDLAEAREMEAAARAAGRVLMEGFMYRFHPQHALVKELIRKGAIGRVFLFEAHFHYFMDDLNNIRLKRETGGGGLYDAGLLRDQQRPGTSLVPNLVSLPEPGGWGPRPESMSSATSPCGSTAAPWPPSPVGPIFPGSRATPSTGTGGSSGRPRATCRQLESGSW